MLYKYIIPTKLATKQHKKPQNKYRFFYFLHMKIFTKSEILNLKKMYLLNCSLLFRFILNIIKSHFQLYLSVYIGVDPE